MSTPTKEVLLTRRDVEQLAKAFTCMKGESALDYAKFAAAAGFANANSAKASWHSLKKKIDRAVGAGATISMLNSSTCSLITNSS
jgi:Ca2+-binding EF-hand superfamily protein